MYICIYTYVCVYSSIHIQLKDSVCVTPANANLGALTKGNQDRRASFEKSLNNACSGVIVFQKKQLRASIFAPNCSSLMCHILKITTVKQGVKQLCWVTACQCPALSALFLSVSKKFEFVPFGDNFRSLLVSENQAQPLVKMEGQYDIHGPSCLMHSPVSKV